MEVWNVKAWNVKDNCQGNEAITGSLVLCVPR